MSHPVVLPAHAINNVDEAFEYYNRRPYVLGIEFTDTLDVQFTKSSRLTTASVVRFDNARVKPIHRFKDIAFRFPVRRLRSTQIQPSFG